MTPAATNGRGNQVHGADRRKQRQGGYELQSQSSELLPFVGAAFGRPSQAEPVSAILKFAVDHPDAAQFLGVIQRGSSSPPAMVRFISFG